MEIRPMTQEERLYADRQSMQIQGQTGSIGQLAGRMEGNGHSCEPKQREPPSAQKSPKHKDHER